MGRFSRFIAVLLLTLPGFTGCENPADPGGKPEPEPEGLRAGLYTFSGDYVPGETEKTAVRQAVLPFSLENAFTVIKAAETPQSCLILVDKEFSFLATVGLPEGTVVVLKGLGGERVVQFYNEGSDGGLFSLSGGQTLILDENITLLGNQANSNPLITLGQDSRLVLYGGASIQEHGGSAVRAASGGEFALEGGNIASCGGSGVAVDSGGTFTMNSGSISGNGGSGVAVLRGGAFTLHDGSIAGNSSGVTVEHGGAFAMKGGSVSGNSSGGGVSVASTGAFVIEGGRITGNRAGSGGGGVHGNFSISGGEISGNTSGDANPLFINIDSVPAALGEGFVIEGYRIITGVGDITLRDVNGYVKTRAVQGWTYACSTAVLGVGGPPQEVSWSISGQSSSGTSIDSATGALRVGSDETAEILFVTASSVTRPEISRTLDLGVDLHVERSLKTKLGITTPGNSIAVVGEVFAALHEYIAAGHLSDANEKGIGPGDYVNLYHLKVEDTVAPGYVAGTIDSMNVTVPNEGGATLRLLVAGVNSYKGANGNAADHLVLQFQHAPLNRRTHDQGSSGYAESEIRKYLSPVEGFENSGCFFAGLKAAGIPEEVFYSPRREASGAAGVGIIEDPVWPTAGDMSAFTATQSRRAVTPVFCVR